MITLVYDGTWIGLLCCVYEIYSKKFKQVFVVNEKRFQPDAFSAAVPVVSDELRARRVWSGLAKRISKKSMNHLHSCYLSELPNIENIICGFIRLAFDMTESPEYAYANPTVLRVSQLDRMVHREKHRMEAFIRFQLTKDDLYFSTVEPDFNVLPLIAKHFKNRYADQRWLIFDLKRNYGIYYDLQAVSEVVIDSTGVEKIGPELFSEDEFLYQKLWKEYFNHVNISERKNTKLHLMHVPKRYWKHLTEKLSI
ncbi:MAG: TIGR03915 family putative DNA repair protein [Bacteroidota bacterium]